MLERVNTFVQLDPSKLRIGYKIKFTKNGHNFVLTSYHKPYHCDCCKKLLWGIGFHGHQCQSTYVTYTYMYTMLKQHLCIFYQYLYNCIHTYVHMYVSAFLFPLTVCEYNVRKATSHDSVESCKKVRSLFQRKCKYILLNHMN